MVHEQPHDPLDVAIIGGGPAGLAAAVYLARFLRSVAVFDASEPRARLIPRTHNCPGFPDGIGGEELLRRLRLQALSFGARIVETPVKTLGRTDDHFTLSTNAGAVSARYVILATGIVDRPPPIADAWAGVEAGLVRLCPVCDAYEARGRRIGVIGREITALKEAEFLRHFSSNVVMLFSQPEDASTATRSQASGAGIGLCDRTGEVVRLHDGFEVGKTDGTPPFRIDLLYAAMGCDVRSGLAAMVGANCDDHGYVLVGQHQETSVPRLYAIGDVVQALNQIAVGFGHAALAATDIHNALRHGDFPRPPAVG